MSAREIASTAPGSSAAANTSRSRSPSEAPISVSGRYACLTVRAAPRQFDVAVTGHNMPGVSGLNAVARFDGALPG